LPAAKPWWHKSRWRSWLQTGHTDMITDATLHKNRMYDDICRRMGVPVFDVSEGTGKATELRS